MNLSVELSVPREVPERALATVRKIDEILPIEGADAIEAARVDGWIVVVKKGEFQPGDLAIYIEIDSWVPHSVAPFLSKDKEPREYNGVKGERLRTVKLRGQVSQGLLLPADEAIEGDDVTALMGIQKWERPLPKELQGVAKGNFPTHLVPKTDAPRIQNLGREIEKWRKDGTVFNGTEKLEGTSFTILSHEGEIQVCSRNLSLERNDANLYWKMAIETGLVDTIQDGVAIQGEIIGSSVQGNYYGLPEGEHRLYVFGVYDIEGRRYLGDSDVHNACEFHGLERVTDICRHDFSEDELSPIEKARFRTFVPSAKKVHAEGIVFKSVDDPSVCFKAINNDFLLKTGG